MATGTLTPSGAATVSGTLSYVGGSANYTNLADASDSTYGDLSASSATALWPVLTGIPTDIQTVTGISVALRLAKAAKGDVKQVTSIQLFKADGTTALSGSIAVASQTTAAATYTVTPSVSLTSQSDWNEARIKVVTNSGTAAVKIYDISITITYTAVVTEVYAVATGNSSSGATWNTGTVPTSTQDVYANGYTVTVDSSTHWKNAYTTAGTTAVAGGTFALANGVTLTLNNGAGNAVSGTSNCITYSGTSGNTAVLIGNPIGSATTTSRFGATNTSSGTLNITGNPLGGSASTSHGANNNSTGTVNITGAPQCGGSSANGARNASTGTLNVTGNPVGNSIGTAVYYAAGNGTITGSPTGSGINAGTVINGGTGTVTIDGSVIGGSAAGGNGVTNSGAGTTIVTGDATGGTNATAYGASNTGSGSLIVNGKAISATAPGVFGSTASTLTSVGSAETGSACIAPLSGKVVFANLATATYGIRNSAATLGTLTAGGGSRPAAFKQQVIG